MKRLLSAFILSFCFAIMVPAQQADLPQALLAATKKLNRTGMNDRCGIARHEIITRADGSVLFYLFHLNPTGYIVVSGQCELPPVIAYSFTNPAGPGNVLTNLVTADLTKRLKFQPETSVSQNRAVWKDLAGTSKQPLLFQQWPEPGTTATGGWLETNWTQDSPYNNLCPLDPVTSLRSIAGCPAVAMAMIVNFHQTVNGVHFDDADDYYHSYAGRNYMIDDDYSTVDFPSFPDLNAFLDTLEMNYLSGKPLEDRDMAALTFACGVAATQVFTSSASGTFGVDQAFQAYQKFNFDECELLMGTDTTVNTRMAQNIKDTLPVHLAVVDPGWTMGHNVVVDGYNTDEYFHLNFGWGGTYNGWYLLPEEIPYGLTVIEGVVVDIVPDDVTAIGSQQKMSMVLYPNPAKEMVHVNADGNYYSASIYASDGSLLRTVQMERTEPALDVSDLPQGLYFILLTGQNRTTSGKLLINR